jgi:hypothetical protein
MNDNLKTLELLKSVASILTAIEFNDYDFIQQSISSTQLVLNDLKQIVQKNMKDNMYRDTAIK